MKGVDEPLEVLTVCGVGMGTSLILRMQVEQVLRDLGVEARVQAMDVSSARSMHPDVLLGQGMHTEEFAGSAPIVLTVSNFMDTDGLRGQLAAALSEKGWMPA